MLDEEAFLDTVSSPVKVVQYRTTTKSLNNGSQAIDGRSMRIEMREKLRCEQSKHFKMTHHG